VSRDTHVHPSIVTLRLEMRRGGRDRAGGGLFADARNGQCTIPGSRSMESERCFTLYALHCESVEQRSRFARQGADVMNHAAASSSSRP
jgi:hypothetical protein